MAFKSKVKSILKELQASTRNLFAGQRQQALVEAAHYEAICKHFDAIEKQANTLVSRISEQIEQLNGQMMNGNESLTPQASSAILSLSEELKSQQSDFIEQINELRGTISESAREEVATKDVSDRIAKLSSSVTKHNMVIEDLIESLEDSHTKQQETLSQMQKLVNREEKDEIRALKANEKALLNLVETYQDQLYTLSRAAKDDPSWDRQFAFVRQKLLSPLQASGISIIEDVNVPVSYDLHEVIDRTPTDDRLLDKCVAEVFACGYMFNGEVQRKAQISAYAYVGEETAESAPAAETAAEPDSIDAQHIQSPYGYGIDFSGAPTDQSNPDNGVIYLFGDTVPFESTQDDLPDADASQSDSSSSSDAFDAAEAGSEEPPASPEDAFPITAEASEDPASFRPSEEPAEAEEPVYSTVEFGEDLPRPDLAEEAFPEEVEEPVFEAVTSVEDAEAPALSEEEPSVAADVPVSDTAELVEEIAVPDSDEETPAEEAAEPAFETVVFAEDDDESVPTKEELSDEAEEPVSDAIEVIEDSFIPDLTEDTPSEETAEPVFEASEPVQDMPVQDEEEPSEDVSEAIPDTVEPVEEISVPAPDEEELAPEAVDLIEDAVIPALSEEEPSEDAAEPDSDTIEPVDEILIPDLDEDTPSEEADDSVSEPAIPVENVDTSVPAEEETDSFPESADEPMTSDAAFSADKEETPVTETVDSVEDTGIPAAPDAEELSESINTPGSDDSDDSASIEEHSLESEASAEVLNAKDFGTSEISADGVSEAEPAYDQAMPETIPTPESLVSKVEDETNPPKAEEKKEEQPKKPPIIPLFSSFTRSGRSRKSYWD